MVKPDNAFSIPPGEAHDKTPGINAAKSLAPIGHGSGKNPAGIEGAENRPQTHCTADTGSRRTACHATDSTSLSQPTLPGISPMTAPASAATVYQPLYPTAFATTVRRGRRVRYRHPPHSRHGSRDSHLHNAVPGARPPAMLQHDSHHNRPPRSSLRRHLQNSRPVPKLRPQRPFLP